MNVLFICSRNQWRSPTAERVFSKSYGIATRSAGTSKQARHTLSTTDLFWAQIIFVMEEKHQKFIKQHFQSHLTHQNIIVLDIPDEYGYMDQDLIDILMAAVPPYLL